MQKYVGSYSGGISVICRLFMLSNSNGPLNFKLNQKMHKTFRRLQGKNPNPRDFAYFTKAICMKIIFIPFFSNSMYICYVTVITLLRVCKAKGGSQVKNNTGRLMTLCFANTMQKMLKDYDAHICLFYYCGLNVVSSVTSELIFHLPQLSLLKK